MRDAQKPDHISLNLLVNHLKEGRFVIPDFQREFEWEPWDIRDLMRSIFLDYYIGSFLLWKGKKENFDSLSCEIIYGFKDNTEQLPWDFGSGTPEHIVLDGQQRLTAIYYTFVAPDVALPNRTNRAVYFIHVDKFIEERFDEAFQYDWLSRRFNRVLENPEIQYSEHIFPLSVVGAGSWDLPNWVQGYEAYWKTRAENYEDFDLSESPDECAKNAENAKMFGKHLKGITEEYQIAYVELDRDIEVDKVCDIFTQINSRGIRLDVFDLINALLKPKGLQLKHMWRAASTRLSFIEKGKMNVYVLQVMSILSQAYCSPKYLYYLLPGQEKQTRSADGKRHTEILIPDIESFTCRWDEAVDTIEYALNLLRNPREFGAITAQYLPYVSIIPAFAALQAACAELPATAQLDAKRKIRYWYWASVFTNRYSGAVESTSARDFLDVKTWMNDEDAEPALIHEFKDRFRNLDLRKEMRKGTSVYNGIFNLLVLQGARDWITGDMPQHNDLDDHHIVPTSWSKDNRTNSSIHSILNRTPLSAETNRQIIGDSLPNEYLPELIAENGQDQVREVLGSHFISPQAEEVLLRDPFGPDDYEEFIIERQRTFLDAIENLLIKERLDLSASLRELDRGVEKTELSLRNLIVQQLDDNLENLPQHVSVKISDKIQRAARKNAAIDTDNMVTLSTRLEYADFRELQESITSKSTWKKFESIFANKEFLNTKFEQLTALRNSIRHNRSVDQVTRMEGEASIIWFTEVLAQCDTT